MSIETRGGVPPQESKKQSTWKRIALGLGLAGALGGAIESGRVGVEKAEAEPDTIEHVQKKSGAQVKGKEFVKKDMVGNVEEVDVTPGDYDAETNEVYEYGKADIPELQLEGSKVERSILKNENYLALQKTLRATAPSFNFVFDTFGEDGSTAGKIYSSTSKKEVYRVAFSNPEAGTCTISMIGEDGKEITGSEERFNSTADLAKELERRKDTGVLD